MNKPTAVISLMYLLIAFRKGSPPPFGTLFILDHEEELPSEMPYSNYEEELIQARKLVAESPHYLRNSKGRPHRRAMKELGLLETYEGYLVSNFSTEALLRTLQSAGYHVYDIYSDTSLLGRK